jgi:hypothetical protein
VTITANQCQQCGRLDLKLFGGRCETCRHRTPAEVWAELRRNTPADIRVESFGQSAKNSPLRLNTTLAPLEDVERVLSTLHMGEGRIMTYVETLNGIKARYEFPVNSENIPSKEEVYGLLAHQAL